MKNLLIHVLVFLGIAVCLWSCSDEDNNEPTLPTCVDRTVLIYMACDNNIWKFAHEDLQEIKEGVAQMGTTNANIHVLVYYDNGNSAQLIALKSKHGKVEEKVVKPYPTPRNSTGITETKEVFQDAFNRFPARNYGLVYWSHGDGWLPSSNSSTRWIGQDDDGENMNISELNEALQVTPHLDFLLFDACFMQSIEVAYELQEHSDYFIGSPTETPGPGAPYNKIIPAMFSTQPALDIAQRYFQHYEATYLEKYDKTQQEKLKNNRNFPFDTNKQWIAGLSTCVIQSNTLPRLAQITRQTLTQANHIAIKDLKESVFDYDRRGNKWSSNHYGYYDMLMLMQELLNPSDFETWEEAFLAVRPYWHTTNENYSDFEITNHGLFSMKNANGISHYIPARPDNKLTQAYHKMKWYQDAGLEQLGW